MWRTVLLRPSSNSSRSSVASDARIAEPYWKPCVHSVHPRVVYLPSIVKTGVPLDLSQVDSSERTFWAARSNTRVVALDKSDGVIERSMFMDRTSPLQSSRPRERRH